MATDDEKTKRRIEDDNASEDRATKRTKTDAEPEAAAEQQETKAETKAPEAADVKAQADADAADGDAVGPEGAGEELAVTTESSAPVKLGYRTFSKAQEASDYISEILKKAKPGEPLNEYEVLLLLDLVQKGHPRASEKLAKGVKSFKVEETRVSGVSTVCFHIEALDGSLEDFSYRKCLQRLFPDYVMKESNNSQFRRRRGADRRNPEGGGGGGRGRGGRGRGGRGRGRGRGRH